jgi:8-oxo-dGTP pyrophosphatase MutT (NUDIX family)
VDAESAESQPLIREMEEEVGIKVKCGQPVHVFNYSHQKDGRRIETTQINFLVVPESESYRVKLSAEHQTHAYITEDDIERYPLTDEVRKALKKAFRLR